MAHQDDIIHNMLDDRPISRRDALRRLGLVGGGVAAGGALGTLFDRSIAEASERVDTRPYKKNPPWRIGFSNISVVNTWRVQMVAELKYEASKHPIKQLLITDAGGNASKQISDIEDLLAKNVDALLVTPTSPDALVPVLTQAYHAGVVIIIFNAKVNTTNYTAFLAADEVEFGKIGGAWLNKQLHGKGNIVALDGIAGNSVSADRFNGAKSQFGPGIKILAHQPADWAYDKGKAVMENLLAAYPHIDGIYSQGGAMSQGAVEAILAANRPLVPITAEGSNGFLKIWAARHLHSIGPDEPTWQSGLALQLAIKALQGQALVKFVPLPLPTITDATLHRYVRPDLPDSFWANTHLPEKVIDQLYKK